jgi:MSHA pilin protein MshD
MCSRRRQGGFSLIEVVVFIVVLGIAFVGMLTLYNRVTSASVDPMVRKQALAIASSLLEEIELRPFTICDPDDPKVYTANSIADCTSAAHRENIGPETIAPANAETRYGGADLATDPRFDNVSDYHGFSMAGANIKGLDGTPIGGLADYAVSVTVEEIGTLPSVATASDALRITVTATGPAGVNVILQGYRLRYAPNSP